MSIEKLPVAEIARIFERDPQKIKQIYQDWLTRRRENNRSVAPDIKLLAALSGLSTASISNFLRDKHDKLSKKNIERLGKLVEIAGYVPSRAAQGLRKQRHNAVGIAMPLTSISPGFYLEILSGVHREADILGFQRFIFDITTVEARDAFFGQMPFLDIVDGLIAVGLYISPEQLRILNQHQLPVVTIHNRIKTPPVVANILPPNEHLLQDLIDQHLIKYHGYRRLAFVTLDTSNPLKMGNTTLDDWSRVARNDAYAHALALNDIPYNEHLVFKVAEHSFEEGYKSCDQICALNETLPPEEKIQAIVCTSDTLAAAVVTAASRKGIQIPVTGFDNLSLAKMMNITTIDQRAGNAGRLAFRHLYNALIYQKREEKFPALVEEGVDMRMVIRRSCGCK